ncbi:CPBP family intramembrane metalloprotease [Cellulomonas sp. ACRRI]|uniref:CPBP family intramembrane glutamic endopeptidase n=1 Tax=Cellulomonas sp. ACRRI TaxID=2918188 RepID=UPI001EF16A79|nr:CPBP family intramembrane glutamic endopeptidase [Cellulomonas sp. ACRRI]MCG7286864.1 CPBP family intramembrane metalloprotease [Cellulomonas sp. ACRRI]
MQQYRVRPSVWIGVAAVLGYVLLVALIQRLSGVPYPELGDSGSNLFRGVGISLIVGTLALAALTTALGWWRPALHEQHRAAHRWPLIAPLVLGVLAVLNLVGTDWGAYDGGFFAASLVLLLVGFTEEITTRGLLVVGLRSRLGEGWVWFLSSLAFGLIHLVNAFGGQALGATVFQVVSAFLFGTALYILRRVTGTLVWAMALHALWDFSVFAAQRGEASGLANNGALELLVEAFALVAVVWVIRGAHERLAPGLERQPAAA